MDVVVWLRSLGLGKYEALFHENDIDDTVVLTLTAEDLKELGVTSFGHRRKLLDAVAALRSDAGTKAADEPRSGTSAPGAFAEDRAERRQVTVMFSDLVGSTALSARMDPEDLREVISAYQKCAAETVQRFGGFVAKYMGDGVLVYFGYPQAHEDDAERAVRAGLELVAAVGDSVPHDLRTTTALKQSWTNSMPCWRRPRPPSRTPPCLLRCCHCRTMDGIPCLRSTRSSVGRERLKRSPRRWRRCRGRNPY